MEGVAETCRRRIPVGGFLVILSDAEAVFVLARQPNLSVGVLPFRRQAIPMSRLDRQGPDTALHQLGSQIPLRPDVAIVCEMAQNGKSLAPVTRLISRLGGFKV